MSEQQKTVEEIKNEVKILRSVLLPLILVSLVFVITLPVEIIIIHNISTSLEQAEQKLLEIEESLSATSESEVDSRSGLVQATVPVPENNAVTANPTLKHLERRGFKVVNDKAEWLILVRRSDLPRVELTADFSVALAGVSWAVPVEQHLSLSSKEGLATRLKLGTVHVESESIELWYETNLFGTPRYVSLGNVPYGSEILLLNRQHYITKGNHLNQLDWNQHIELLIPYPGRDGVLVGFNQLKVVQSNS